MVGFFFFKNRATRVQGMRLGGASYSRGRCYSQICPHQVRENGLGEPAIRDHTGLTEENVFQACVFTIFQLLWENRLVTRSTYLSIEELVIFNPAFNLGTLGLDSSKLSSRKVIILSTVITMAWFGRVIVHACF